MTTQIESQNESAVLTFNANFLGEPIGNGKVSDTFNLTEKRADEIADAIDGASDKWFHDIQKSIVEGKNGDEITLDSSKLMGAVIEKLKGLGELTIEEFAYAFYYFGADYNSGIHRAKGMLDKMQRLSKAASSYGDLLESLFNKIKAES